MRSQTDLTEMVASRIEKALETPGSGFQLGPEEARLLKALPGCLRLGVPPEYIASFLTVAIERHATEHQRPVADFLLDLDAELKREVSPDTPLHQLSDLEVLALDFPEYYAYLGLMLETFAAFLARRIHGDHVDTLARLLELTNRFGHSPPGPEERIALLLERARKAFRAHSRKLNKSEIRLAKAILEAIEASVDFHELARTVHPPSNSPLLYSRKQKQLHRSIRNIGKPVAGLIDNEDDRPKFAQTALSSLSFILMLDFPEEELDLMTEAVLRLIPVVH